MRNATGVLAPASATPDPTETIEAFAAEAWPPDGAEPVVLDLNAVVRDAIPMLRRLIGSHIRVTTRLPGHPLWVRVDRVQLQQVVTNLSGGFFASRLVKAEISVVGLANTIPMSHRPS